ncbi:MAG: hypothetical protein JNM64_02715 [Chloroflexia bacterium]|nr:hypothetical protein [Chloroflexia bacterium]
MGDLFDNLAHTLSERQPRRSVLLGLGALGLGALGARITVEEADARSRCKRCKDRCRNRNRRRSSKNRKNCGNTCRNQCRNT